MDKKRQTHGAFVGIEEGSGPSEGQMRRAWFATVIKPWPPIYCEELRLAVRYSESLLEVVCSTIQVFEGDALIGVIPTTPQVVRSQLRKARKLPQFRAFVHC